MAARALVICLALAVLHTWPLALDPAGLSRNDNADTVLNEWIVAWVVHQAPRQVSALFDANIFYPERNVLAFSEHLAVQAVMAAPLLWLGASPVLAYNLLVIAGFALSAWTMWLVVARWTGSDAAGAVAGSLLAFNAHTLTRLPHLQALHLEFLPLAWLALDALLRTPRVRTALALGLLVALQSLTSNYLLVFTALAIAISAGVRPAEWVWPLRWRVIAGLCLAAGVALLVVLPFLVPYYLARQDQGLTRSLDEVALYSSTWRDYVATGGRLHYWLWSHRVFEGATALFPGLTALALAGAGVLSGAVVRDPRARMCAAAGLAGLVLSFGPAVPGYAWLHHALPLLQGLRGAARFGFLLLVAVSVLAGFGLAALQRRVGQRAALAIGASAAILVNVEALRAPMSLSAFAGIPAICSQLPRDADAVFLHFPIYSAAHVSGNTDYMLCSTEHWRPIVNGYSGHIPPLYHQHLESLKGFPDEASIRYLRAMKVTHVILHADKLPAEWVQSVRDSGHLRLSMTDGTRLVFEVAGKR